MQTLIINSTFLVHWIIQINTDDDQDVEHVIDPLASSKIETGRKIRLEFEELTQNFTTDGLAEKESNGKHV